MFKFTREQSIDFLIKGFKEYNIEPLIDLIDEAVNRLDGIEGITRNAIEETFIKGTKLISEELYRRSKRYRYALEAITHGHRTWSMIKKIHYCQRT